MKNILKFVVVAALLWACGDTEKVNEKSIIVAGILESAEPGSIDVSVIGLTLATDTVNEDGSFRIEFNNHETDFFMVSTGKTAFSLFLSPGDSIYITANTDEFADTFTAEGSKSQEAVYMRKKLKTERESGLNDYFTLMKLEKEAYFAKKDSLLIAAKQPLEELKQKEGISSEFLDLENAYYEFTGLLMDNMYPNYYAYLNKIQNQEEIDFPKEEIKEKIAKVDFNNTDYLKIDKYKQLIQTQLNEQISAAYKADTTLRNDPDAYTRIQYAAIDSVVNNQTIRDFLKFDVVNNMISYGGPVAGQELYEQFLSVNKTPRYNEILEKAIAKWDPIMPGKEVPDFTFTTIQDEEVKLSNLRGKLVYIDVWATWCGPCIAEHPHWDKLKADFEGKDVEFVTVSIDNTKEPWVKMVNDKGMDGHQWYADKAWQSDLATHFMINAIPRFLLLDREGKVINPSAARPSGNIRETLDKHLAESI